MYLEFYGFRENPFNVTPDPRFFYESRNHRDAVAYLKYGVQERKGFLVLTGEVGVGKTIVLRSFLRDLGAQADTALILSSSLPFRQLLLMAMEDLGLKTRRKCKGELLMDLNAHLLRMARLDKLVLLVIDEAQNLSLGALEEIRQLSNLETDQRKLLGIILAGQPELRNILAARELRQLRQRIPGICSIGPLSFDEERGYVEHRIAVASAGEPRVRFTEGAIEWVHSYAGGIPRLINVLCDRCILLGYLDDRHVVDDDLVRAAVQELERDSVERRASLVARAG
jgi:general secretion pathway protein A